MLRNTSESVAKQSWDEAREPDDLKESERSAQVGRRDRDGEYEDIEALRSKSRRADEDLDEIGELDEIDEDDLVEEVDLDAQAEGDGPDA